jgi:hypothetical protein
MQSNAARALVALGSIAAVVVLLIVFAGGDDGGDGGTTVAEPATTTETGGSAKPEKPNKPAKPEFTRITVVDGQPKGGVSDLSYSKGDEVRLEVASDVAEEVHVHGYDISKDVEAGGDVKISFDAGIEGVFEVELEQTAVQIAQLTVKP